ncbi:hypothetical protein GY45DRAFT_1375554 [Cubamyces sp. BRFM 1775]|nr:hypothetical protein GY45DRAFT_1375554 [Cubamyces sp. BRFM 1775]
MRLIHCGHVFCHGCLLSVIEIGSGVCPNHCGDDAPIVGWTAIHFNTKSVANEDQVSIAIEKRLSELVVRQVQAEQRHLTAAAELDAISKQVRNQYKLIQDRQRYLRSSLSDIEKSFGTVTGRSKKQLQQITRKHRLIRARKLKEARLQREAKHAHRRSTGVEDGAPGPSEPRAGPSAHASSSNDSSGPDGRALHS